MSDMKAANRVIANTGILYGRMALTVFISLYGTRVVLAALGVSDFGIFNLVAGAILMLTFLNTAMSSATQRFMSFAEGAGNSFKLKAIFNVSVILHIIIAFLVLIILEAVGYFLFDDILKIPPLRLDVAKLIFQFMIVSTLLSIVTVPYDAVINAHENMMLYAVISTLESLMKLGIALITATSRYDKLITYGLLMTILSVVLLLIKRIYCNKKYPECEINFATYFDRPIFKEMTNFAAWAFLGSSTSIIANYGQGIVLNMFFGTVVNASQGIANQVSGQLGTFATTMLKALNPILAKSEGAGNRDLMLKATMMGSKVSFFLLMFMFIPVLIEMPYIFGLWLKDVPAYAILFCRLLLVRNLIEQLFYTLNSSISAVGNIKMYQISSSILTFFPLIVCYYLFNIGYPPQYLYIVFIIYSLLTAINILYYSRRNFALPIKEFSVNVIFRCCISFTIIYLLSIIPTIILGPGFIRFLFVGLISTLVFPFSVWLIGFAEKDRLYLSALGKSIKNNLLIKVKKFRRKRSLKDSD